MARGRLIVFEGIDGAGKSTQIKHLKNALGAKGREVLLTAEPTDGVTGKMLRAALAGKDERTPYEMAALFVLDRIYHNKQINEALDKGLDVICDRYYYSSLAYQGSICDFEWVRHMNCNCPEIRHPDLCVFLDLTPKAALARITARGEATEIYEKEETLTLFRATFLKIFETLGDPVAIVDASGTEQEVADKVLAAVETALK